MEFEAVVRGRRMIRSFEDRPVPAEMLDRILAGAGGHLMVLDHTETFWAHVSDPQWREDPTWPGLLRAPTIVLPLAGQDGRDLVEASFATMVVLLAITDAGLGALFFRIRRGEDQLGIPDHLRAIGAIALGWPDGEDRPSSSVARGRTPVVHRGRWHKTE